MSRDSNHKLLECKCGALFIQDQQLKLHRIKCDEVDEKDYDVVSKHQCKRWRKVIKTGKSVSQLSDGVDFSKSTVQIHVRGDCNHVHEVSSLTWIDERSEWVIDS